MRWWLMPDEGAVGGRMVRRWAWVGIVLFVVADAVLIMIALQHTSDGADSASAGTVAASPATPSVTPPAAAPPSLSTGLTPAISSPAESATADATTEIEKTTTTATLAPTSTSSRTEPGPPGSAATVLLDMASDGSAIRATRGSCPAGSDGAATGPARIEVSGDAGATWSPVDVAAAAVERVAAGRGGKSWFVAAGTDCTLTEHDAAAGGSGWTTSSPEGAWALPVDAAATSILAPVGDVEIGCTPVSLAAIDSRHTVVACSDGALRTSADSGKTWTDGATVPGVAGISFVGPNSGYALAKSDGCAAQVWRTTNGAKSFTKLACLGGATPQAITAAGSTILAQVDGAMQRSNDEGKTWSRTQ